MSCKKIQPLFWGSFCTQTNWDSELVVCDHNGPQCKVENTTWKKLNTHRYWTSIWSHPTQMGKRVSYCSEIAINQFLLIWLCQGCSLVCLSASHSDLIIKTDQILTNSHAIWWSKFVSIKIADNDFKSLRAFVPVWAIIVQEFTLELLDTMSFPAWLSWPLINYIL